MSKEELNMFTQQLRQLRTSPPTMAKSLRDDEEVQDVVESQGKKTRKSSSGPAKEVNIDALLAQAEQFVKKAQ